MGSSSVGLEFDSTVAQAICVDLVAYSLLSIEEQARSMDGLRQAIAALPGLRAAEAGDTAMVKDAGDGAIIVVFGSPASAMAIALSLDEEAKARGLRLRMGIHAGPVTHALDAAGSPNAYGPAINIAERIMRCADEGHILLSASMAEMVEAFEHLRGHAIDFGETEVKHGLRLRVFSYCDGLHGRKDRPSKVPASRQGAHNFVDPERSFIGRAAECESLRCLLLDERRRLVTVTGPGGMGKTRIACEVATRIAPDFADGAWLVECDFLNDPDQLIVSIGTVLNVPAGANVLEALQDALADQQILIVLDCLEHIVAAAPTIDELLKRCPEVQVLATSRILLGLPRETEVVLGPMALKRDAGGIAEAVRLFTDAARSVSPELKFGRRTQATVAQIVRRLEGVPLALILAAGRLRYMSLVELKEQLEKGSLDVLKRRAVGRDRHADLSSVVDDSFGLLPDRERETLVQLTVFQGGFFLPDAEAVLGSGRAIRDSVTELRDHSLLITQVSQGRMRYRSLDVISEFAARRADEAALAPLRARHAAHYAARAAEVRGRFDAGQWQDANARLWADLGNFQRAMGFALATADADIIRKFAATLARILMEAGLRSDFERLALAAEEISERDGDLALHLEITGLLGGMYRRDNKRELAERYWTARAETYAQTGDSEGEADAWNDLAGLAQTWGDNAALDRYLAEFERLAGRLPRGPVLANGYSLLATSRLASGDREGALLYAGLAAGVLSEIPDLSESFFARVLLAEAWAGLGRIPESRAICRKGVQDAVESRHPAFAGHFLVGLAACEGVDGYVERAALGLAIAQRIPKSVSQSFRDKVRTAREVFVTKYGADAMRRADSAAGEGDWQALALELAKASES